MSTEGGDIDNYIEVNSNILNSINGLPLSDKERNIILVDFNNTKKIYDKEKTIQQLFEEQVRKTPNSTAIVFKDKTLSYKELNKKANILAHRLRNKGITKDTIVGILLKRSIDVIVAMLGVLKSGGAYLPLDPSYPDERINLILEDSQCRVLLTQSQIATKIKTEKVLVLQDVCDETEICGDTCENINDINTSNDLAYVIYTSGSTGKPKGVMIEHRSVNNFAKGIARKIDFSPGKTVMALTTISFDIFVLETILPLISGVKVVLVDEAQQKNPELLINAILKYNIDMLQITPSRLKLLINYKNDLSYLKNLKEIMVGGEEFPKSILEILKKSTDAKIYNLYGPTETTVWSTIQDLTYKNKIDIGKPIDNTQIYIVDENINIQPIGVEGELCISGDGLARGYLNSPDLTQEKFIPNPFVKGGRLYKTGDLAKWLPDGNIKYIGRIDFQVKVNGFRIELEEIQTLLQEHESVRETVVTSGQNMNGETYISTYIVLTNKNDDFQLIVPKLREYLKSKLPDYMIPSFFIQLETVPLTPNGKVDRKNLPEPVKFHDLNKDILLDCENATERRIAVIWMDILKIQQIGVNENYFEVGGNSLNFFVMTKRLSEEFDIDVKDVKIFELQTIKKIAEYINEGYVKCKDLDNKIVDIEF